MECAYKCMITYKQAYKELAVPVDSDIARNLQRQEEADRLEKERVKKLTLEISERQEEEDMNDAIAAVRIPDANLAQNTMLIL